MKKTLMFVLALGLTVPAFAQTVVTPAYVLAWEQDGVNVGTFTYETSTNSGAAAPVVGVTCTGSPTASCRGTLPQSLADGSNTVALRAIRTLDSVAYTGPYTTPITFNFISNPTPGAPRNLQPILPPGQGAAAEGIVFNEPLLGLTSNGFTVSPGDHYFVTFWRP